MTEFTSPLQDTSLSGYAALGFGEPERGPAVLALRDNLELRLHATMAPLPAALRSEAISLIDAYGGGPRRFIGLFYQPVWSYLAWLPLDGAIAPDLLGAARTAQALGLFLHLWDDHLCDGQLKVDQLRLQMRTLAWMDYVAAAGRLCAACAPGSGAVESATGTYLSAIHAETGVPDLAAFRARFTRQVAIWTLVPRLIGTALGGPGTGDILVAIVEAFSDAWRLMDDVQDVEGDLLAGVHSAVWHALDADGRAAWDDCRARSLAAGVLDPASWATLHAFLQAPACVPHLLVQVYDSIERAAALADGQGWTGYAAELRQHQPFAV